MLLDLMEDQSTKASIRMISYCSMWVLGYMVILVTLLGLVLPIYPMMENESNILLLTPTDIRFRSKLIMLASPLVLKRLGVYGNS